MAREMPDLESIAACVFEPVERVEVYFDAEILGGDLTPEPHVLDGDDRLCAMGRLACEGEAFLWPRPHRC